jgi:H+/gluconate symporter-like permease
VDLGKFNTHFPSKTIEGKQMYLGIILAVVLFIYLAMRGVSIFLVALICTLVVIFTNNMPLDRSLQEYFPFGPLGAFTFAGNFFLLFMAGAMFGRVIGDSGAASSIALALVKKLGANRALWITVLATSLLTYGGVVVFVVIFAMYPLGLRLLQEANIPKRLFVGAIALGAGTYTLSALPGTPSLQNIISSRALNTDLFAAAPYGLFGGFLMFAIGMYYLEKQRIKAAANGEGFEASERDKAIMASISDEGLPTWKMSIIPLFIVILTILLPRLLPILGLVSADNSLIVYASSQPLLWPSIALIFGIVISVALFPALRTNTLQTIGKGAEEAIIPLLATSVVIGFGGVVTQTQGFTDFTLWINTLDMPPLMSVFASVSLVSAIVGSASGGLQIFMGSMAQPYIDQGMDPEVLHRIATMASGGFDSLPHCGAVVAILTITGLTHKQGYKDLGVVTVVIPVFATLATMAII